MRGSETFVPLHVLLAPPVVAPHVEPDASVRAPEAPRIPERAPDELRALLRDVRVFRSRLADAFADAHGELMRELAYAVLGRELHLAPVDVRAIVARVRDEHPSAELLCVRVAPADAETLAAPVAVIADPSLAAGDAILEFADGRVDARLGVRVAAVLEAWS